LTTSGAFTTTLPPGGAPTSRSPVWVFVPTMPLHNLHICGTALRSREALGHGGQSQVGSVSPVGSAGEPSACTGVGNIDTRARAAARTTVGKDAMVAGAEAGCGQGCEPPDPRAVEREGAC